MQDIKNLEDSLQIIQDLRFKTVNTNKYAWIKLLHVSNYIEKRMIEYQEEYFEEGN